MKFLHYGKDGGPESTVHGFWLIEIKSLFSIALLRFDNGSRDSYHTHAFNCKSWVLSGKLREQHLKGKEEVHHPSFKPVTTKKSTFHRVISEGTTWVLTFRGPWDKTWEEYNPITKVFTALTHGRKEVTSVNTIR